MTKFLDIFTPIHKGNFGLTDEAIYKSIQSGGSFIPVWGGTQEHITVERLVSENGKTKYDEPITVFSGDGIIISLDGSSGWMTHVTRKRFALNHHAGFFQVNEEAKQSINPDFFSLFYTKQLQEISISEGSKTLTPTMIESIDFDIPQYDVQEKVMSQIKPLLAAKEKTNDLLARVYSINGRVPSVEYEDYQAKDIPISDVLDCYGGNTGLTEEQIYQNIQVEGQKYEVMSSSTKEDTKMGRIPICSIDGKQLEVFEDKEGILVIRNGKAGTTFFLDKGKYAITDHAYILSLKDGYKYAVSLKWLMFQYRHSFLDYVSTSPNATWNMSGFFKEVEIVIPSYREQLELVKKFDYLELLQSRLESILAKIDRLFVEQIVV
jgi:restriction endonuclease S subunit